VSKLVVLFRFFVYCSSKAFQLVLSSGATVYSDPGSSGFTPPSPLTCDSYVTSGSANVMQEVICCCCLFCVSQSSVVQSYARFVYNDALNIQGSFFVEPNFNANTNVLLLQLTMQGCLI
jgi:hypothetical protein